MTWLSVCGFREFLRDPQTGAGLAADPPSHSAGSVFVVTVASGGSSSGSSFGFPAASAQLVERSRCVVIRVPSGRPPELRGQTKTQPLECGSHGCQKWTRSRRRQPRPSLVEPARFDSSERQQQQPEQQRQQQRRPIAQHVHPQLPGGRRRSHGRPLGSRARPATQQLGESVHGARRSLFYRVSRWWTLVAPTWTIVNG